MILMWMYAQGWPDQPGDAPGVCLGGESLSTLLRKGQHAFLSADWRTSLSEAQRQLLSFDQRPWANDDAVQDTPYASASDWLAVCEVLERSLFDDDTYQRVLDRILKAHALGDDRFRTMIGNSSATETFEDHSYDPRFTVNEFALLRTGVGSAISLLNAFARQGLQVKLRHTDD